MNANVSTENATRSAERARVDSFGRLEDGLRQAGPWYQWGPYLSERAWGTVREDYSAGGTAWESFPHDHARSRAYRWSEDGLAGISDIEQRLCLALALWNGRDPILKERIFGLTGNQGNHGEDAKEYWWYTDAVPSHAWASWRYHYPQRAFPYDELVAGGRRSPGRAGARAARHRRLRRRHAGSSRSTTPRTTPTTSSTACGSRTRARRRTRCTCCRPSGSATRGPGTRRRCGRS